MGHPSRDVAPTGGSISIDDPLLTCRQVRFKPGQQVSLNTKMVELEEKATVPNSVEGFGNVTEDGTDFLPVISGLTVVVYVRKLVDSRITSNESGLVMS